MAPEKLWNTDFLRYNARPMVIGSIRVRLAHPDTTEVFICVKGL